MDSGKEKALGHEERWRGGDWVSRAGLERAVCCREVIYCCGRLVCSRLLAECWAVEEG